MMGLYYVTLGTNDLAQARKFYEAIMAVIGASLEADYPAAFSHLLPDGGSIWVTQPLNGAPASNGNGTTIGISLDSEARVNAAHKAALAAGGSDEGAPGPRPQYGPAFYGAYVRDLDGNKLAFVHYRNIE
jgi:catechol 2,3-dioxygenase-like lactoylglutathione lyase family enzyme